jgi:hypothetical protein
MLKDRECKHCGFKLPNSKANQIANHERWCKQNPRYLEIKERTGSKIADALKINALERKGEIKVFTVECECCKISFTVKESENLFPLKEKYYCSRSCANKREHSEETKQKIGNSLLKPIKYKICPNCGKEYSTKSNACSAKCSRELRPKKYSALQLYRMKCAFNFALNDFPDEFDFSLIEKHGWYRAKNRGDNLNGVSRDHIVSVKFGFEKNISPDIIKHPANCQLLIHGENISKGHKCNLTIDQLMVKIQEWNHKHNTYGTGLINKRV